MIRGRFAVILAMTAAAAAYAPQAAVATPLAGPGCDFNDNGRDDLAIGVPGEGVGSIGKAGMVHVFFGNSPRLSAAGGTAWHQNVPTVEGVAQAGDAFGAAWPVVTLTATVMTTWSSG